MFESLKSGGKIAIHYGDHQFSFAMSAYKILNPENTERILDMFHVEERAKIEEYCCTAGFHIIKSYDTCMQLVFESIESLLNWISSTLHGVFDLKLVTEERLQRYYPCLNRDGKPPFDFRGIKEESGTCRLVAVKTAGKKS